MEWAKLSGIGTCKTSCFNSLANPVKKLATPQCEYPEIVSGVLEGDMTKISINQKEPLLAELEAFVNCVKNNKESPVPGDDGLKALKLALLFKESAEQNKVIVL